MPHLEKSERTFIKKRYTSVAVAWQFTRYCTNRKLNRNCQEQAKTKDTKTKQKLIRAILDIWNGDDPSIAETCKSLVHSMPSRVDQVIKAR